MRIWHKDLVDVLPDMQLKGQWRECCAIAKNIAMFGTPNHILVNPIMEYPIDHFYTYSFIYVYREMINRGFEAKAHVLDEFRDHIIDLSNKTYFEVIPHNRLFEGWHSSRYLLQCMSNMEEKYDRGGLTFNEWFRIVNKTRSMHAYCEETYQSLFV